MDGKVCFITAVYGAYEASCKPIKKQSIDVDYICFTDNKNIKSNGWIIDTTPYHIVNPSPLDTGNYINSIKHNKHTFNIAKYYKQAFQNIPRLKKYDVIIWLDGSIEITDTHISKYIVSLIRDKKIITWHHEYRNGILKNEVDASNMFRYTSTHWNGQDQPYQDVNKQYAQYIKDGYSESYFKKINNRTHFGVWITCFVAFSNTDKSVSDFLDKWYLQTLQYTTQDQIGFSYTCQKTHLIPHTLPDNNIQGETPHQRTSVYIKHGHGK